MATALIQTARLTGHRFTADDIPLQRTLLTDPVTMRTLAVRGDIASAEEIAATSERHLRHWAVHDFGLWMFCDSATGQFIGNCGLRSYTLRGSLETELGYALRSPFFRMGYGTEMARAVVGIGFGELDLQSIISFTMPDNTASLGVMAKLGMRCEGRIEHAGLPHVLYRLSRRQTSGS